MHIFHKWGKWEVISDRMVSYTSFTHNGVLREIIQKRQCSVCGIVQYKTTDIY